MPLTISYPLIYNLQFLAWYQDIQPSKYCYISSFKNFELSFYPVLSDQILLIWYP